MKPVPLSPVEDTQREHADTQREHALLRTLLAASSDAVLALDADGLVLLASPAAERLLLYPEGQLRGTALDALLQLPAALAFDQFLLAALAALAVPGAPVTALRHDGTPVQLALALTALADDPSLGYLCTLHRSHPHKPVAANPFDADNRFRDLIDNVHEVIFQTDEMGNWTFLNAAWQTVTGFSVEESLGQPFLHFVQLDDREPALEEFRPLITREREFCRHQVRFCTKDGPDRWLEMFARLTFDAHGHCLGTSGTLSDVTARHEAEITMKQARDAAEAASRAKGDFVATMSHEIRTPMNAVIGMTGLLLETELSREQREYAETVRSSGENLLEIINDILDFSKIESSQMELEEFEFSLSECVEDALDLVLPATTSRALELGCVIDPSTPPRVVADITRVRQVLVNLLSNAVKFTEAGDVSVHVSLQDRVADRATLLFAVRDTGIGIAPDRLGRLFQPFSQADSSITRQFGGTGLGLAISKRLATLMGGTLWVESEPAVGSTFYFTMQASIDAPRVARPKLPLRARNVLLIDASQLSAAAIGAQLRRLGVTPIHAASAEDAAAALATHPIDAVLLSSALFAQHGTTLEAALAAARQPNPPVVILTSLGLRIAEAPSGFVPAGWLSKPVKAQSLEQLLLSLLVLGNPSASAAAQADATQDPAPARNIRILVAEDNPINQKVAIRMIKSLGYRADVVGNGLEVLDALKRQVYDVVLMDVQMPEMDGLDATRAIRNATPGVRGPYVIAMTANAMHGDEAICLDAGMDEYLTKPIRVADLKRALDRWAEAHPDASTRSAPGPLPPPHAMLSGQLAEIQNIGGNELVAEIMTEFHLQVESDLAEIATATKGSDYPEIQRLAHRLKGGSTTVGITAVTNLCTELELAAEDHDDRRIATIIERLNREVVRARTLYGSSDASKNVRILIADDHPVVRFGVRRMLQSHAEYVVVGEASDGKEALREMREMQPDILLLDLNMPELPGLETLRELTTIQIPTRTILLTSAISQREILEALQLGARGVVLKDALTTDLATCIATVMQGHYWLGRKPVHNLVQVLNDLMEEIKQPPQNTFGLTVRELQIVRLIAQGMTNKDIARDCDIAEETVKRHLKNIFDKVGVWNRLELALFAINNHLVGDASQAA